MGKGILQFGAENEEAINFARDKTQSSNLHRDE